MFGTSESPPLLGEVHCIGTEPEILECSHSSIGYHYCGRDNIPVPDIIISCYGKFFSIVCILCMLFHQLALPSCKSREHKL